MNPLLKQSQSSKEDSSTMDEQEKKLKEKYGKLPMKKNMLSGMKERKYFDSGDYAMQKAGVAAPDSVGSVGAGQGLRGMEGLERATPERLPHAQPPSLSSSPTNSTILSPPAMPASPGPASPPPTGSAPRGLPIPGGNASQINHSSNATIPIARGSSHSPSSSSSIPAAVNTSGGHSPGSRPNAGSPSPSVGLSPSTSFGAGVAAGQGHSFSAKREGSGGAGPAATSKVGLPGNAGVGVETNRISPPVASHSPLMTSGSVPPSSFPINHHLAGSQSNNPASPSNLRDQNPLLEGAERRSSLSANSPVKPSNLSLGLRRQEENAMED